MRSRTERSQKLNFNTVRQTNTIPFKRSYLCTNPYTRLYFLTPLYPVHTPQRYSVEGTKTVVLRLARARTVRELYLPRPGQLASLTATQAILRYGAHQG